jgi:hypothetical protein
MIALTAQKNKTIIVDFFISSLGGQVILLVSAFTSLTNLTIPSFDFFQPFYFHSKPLYSHP